MSGVNEDRINTEGVDDRIAHVLRNLRQIAQDELGFRVQGTRADGEIELLVGDTRVRLETNSIHGEGRVIVRSRRGKQDGDGGWRQRDVRVTGRDTVTAETTRARQDLLNIVRRATAVKP